MEENFKDENITAQDYIKYLHIAISYMNDLEQRTDMIEHLGYIKDNIKALEINYQLPSYEPKRSV